MARRYPAEGRRHEQLLYWKATSKGLTSVTGLIRSVLGPASRGPGRLLIWVLVGISNLHATPFLAQ